METPAQHIETQNTGPVIIKAVFRVKRKVYLTPHYIQIIVESDDLHLFSAVTVGANNKIFISGKEAEPATIRRTYTLRALNLEAGEMRIDFVAHGEEGPASAWAIHAKEGDQLEIAMKARKNPLYPQADWYLLTGDHTALPVISVMIESLPATAKGIALIEVASPEDVIDIQTDSALKICWIFNDHSSIDQYTASKQLYESVTSIPLPENVTKYVFAAAEAEVIKNLREYFKLKELKREELSAHAYWKKGVSEEGSETERRNQAK